MTAEMEAASEALKTLKKGLKNFKLCEDLKKCEDGCSCNTDTECDICRVIDFTLKNEKL